MRENFGPDIVFAGDGTQEFWAEISAADTTGVAVSGLMNRDVIRILDISGICSFSGGGEVKKAVTSLIGTAKEAVTGPWALALQGLRQLIPLWPGGDARRDGYGQEPGKTGAHTDEGGIILCLPPAKGMIYSNDGTRPTITDNRRIVPAQSPFLFPKRDQGPIPVSGLEDGTKGVLRIAAFDHNYKDNSGVYEVVFTITRPNPQP